MPGAEGEAGGIDCKCLLLGNRGDGTVVFEADFRHIQSLVLLYISLQLSFNESIFILTSAEVAYGRTNVRLLSGWWGIFAQGNLMD